MRRAFLTLFAALATAWAAPEPATTVVIANARVPAGVELARDFMRHRGIPERNLIALDLPTEETIAWNDYSARLLNPLRAKLLTAGLIAGQLTDERDARGRADFIPTAAPKLGWIVLVTGVPLKLRPSGVKSPGAAKAAVKGDQACVDSELALIATLNLDPDGAKPNPWFKTRTPPTAEAAEVIRTARLDGPTVADVRRALEGAWQAEARGLRGRAYIDLGGPYPEGDVWFKAAAERTRQLGFPTDLEGTPKQFGAKARADAPAFYLGWYSQKAQGKFAEPGTLLAPGAIALHLHSFSAESLRAADAGWTPWLVKQGAAHTSGNVYEPYLGLTLRPDLLIDGLQQGLTAGEAAWYATPAVSWQGVILGDPFYRPFARDLQDQLADSHRQPDALGPYAALRAARLHPPAEALAELEAALARTPDLALAYELALAREEARLPLLWPETLWTQAPQADPGLLWEIALFFEKKALKEPARRALKALADRPAWKDDPELKAHLDALAR